MQKGKVDIVLPGGFINILEKGSDICFVTQVFCTCFYFVR